MARQALTCKCGDCTHWEIFMPQPVTIFGHEFNGTAWVHPKAILKCVACGSEYAATFSVDPHDALTQKAVE
jgi:hypothetical protein